MQTLIAANWKMHGDTSWRDKVRQLDELVPAAEHTHLTLLICPPAPFLSALSSVSLDTSVNIGAQNCSEHESGAYTGEISAAMCSNVGCSYVIVGHSERRAMYGETDSIVAAKASAIYEEGLVAIICVGESLEQRESGQAQSVVSTQLAASIPDDATSINTVIAYEPVWAIGTGKTPTLDDIADMHAHIYAAVKERFGDLTANDMGILYGGSVKPANAKDILAVPHVGGALVGGASLDMESFAAIANAAKA